MKHEKDTLLNYIEYKQPTNIYLEDNTVILAKGEGTVKLCTINSGLNVTVAKAHKAIFVGYPLVLKDTSCITWKEGPL